MGLQGSFCSEELPADITTELGRLVSRHVELQVRRETSVAAYVTLVLRVGGVIGDLVSMETQTSFPRQVALFASKTR